MSNPYDGNTCSLFASSCLDDDVEGRIDDITCTIPYHIEQVEMLLGCIERGINRMPSIEMHVREMVQLLDEKDILEKGGE